jgi:hypothetical protein
MVISSLKGIIANWNPREFHIVDYCYKNHRIILDIEEVTKLKASIEQFLKHADQSRILPFNESDVKG